ncbi:hypothetical protein F0562_036046 [Nyssa sinensis]|uniref:Uncharacterized protein n=1 Tax=Nyssa sinensis TaxID=561372 RepID=A0A5J5AHS3_9ASTE|nr:hypothetical protein F0562_036046 [Nyssa sinensis]
MSPIPPIWFEFCVTSSSRAKPSPDWSSVKKKLPEKSIIDESTLDNPVLGPFLLKLARDTITSGDGLSKALDYALRASKSFERCTVDSEPSLDLAISLHVVVAIYCSLGRFEKAIPMRPNYHPKGLFGESKVSNSISSDRSKLITLLWHLAGRRWFLN